MWQLQKGPCCRYSHAPMFRGDICSKGPFVTDSPTNLASTFNSLTPKRDAANGSFIFIKFTVKMINQI
jgi:hypothetical protein